jgi:glucose-1-phosphate thymidylyltransferase
VNKGIILAGGTGTRLRPLTNYVSKHLLDIDKHPIIDYPINTLKQLGITDITIVLGDAHFEQIVYYLKDGSDFGVNFNYIYQKSANGIAFAINLCRQYVINEDNFAVCLGDNLFERQIIWKENSFNTSSAKIVLCDNVGVDISRFGVASIDNNKIVNIVEKPKVLNHSLKNYAITGLYCFNRDYFDYFKHIKLSARSEFEITNVIEQYVANNNLDYTFTSGWWADCGNFMALNNVRELVKQFPVKF